jgi:SRSO17 transposase
VGSRLSAPGPQEKRFAAYIEGLANAAGHEDRQAPLKNYCKGLLLPGERKSIEPMAARLDPEKVQPMRQSLHHLVAKAPWSDEVMLEQVRNDVLPAMQKQGPVVAWIVDDTSFPKKGKHSVGVTRQYCGQLGKQENCRVAVSLSVATWSSSLPIAYRLYLPKEWAEDVERRENTEVPDEVEFQTKPDIALNQIRSESDSCGSLGKAGPWRCAGGRGLRHQHRISRRTHRTQLAICGWRAKLDDGLGTRQAAFTR